jgi:hypothetical protein
MGFKEIEELLEKYYAGATSLDEERQLNAYFSSTDVPENLKNEQLQFNFYASASKEATGANLDKKLDAIARQSKRVPLRPSLWVYRSAAGIAACIFIVIGMGIIRSGNAGGSPVDTRSLIAYQQARQSLLLVSRHLNKGSKQLIRISKFNEIEQHITGKK